MHKIESKCVFSCRIKAELPYILGDSLIYALCKHPSLSALIQLEHNISIESYFIINKIIVLLFCKAKQKKGTMHLLSVYFTF